MPATNIAHRVLPLELEEEQIQVLSQLNQALGEKLEKIGTLCPEMMADLTAAMKEILATQKGYAAIAESARNLQQILHVTHSDPYIRTLPWRLATEDIPLLYLTKGKPLDQGLPILEADHPPLKILVMISSPEDATWDSRLSYEEEEDQIIQTFEPLFNSGQVQIDFTDDGSLENLQEKIAANRYHIIHFSGHGDFSRRKRPIGAGRQPDHEPADGDGRGICPGIPTKTRKHARPDPAEFLPNGQGTTRTRDAERSG